ncbi:MAG: ABC transporter ATP-binding protein [Desulfosarcinaceae bacterium]|nr:ABC transporter ATP-binding protein [Desulfosarcinaceae bacterium]
MSPPRSTPLLAIGDLSVALPAMQGCVRAVDGVTLSVTAGQAVGLVGESGCGKSMLAKALMGLLPREAEIGPTSQIHFDGRPLLALSPRERRTITGRKMAMVFQDPMTALNPVMRVGRQISEVLRHHLGLDRRAARQRALALLRQVGVSMPRRRLDHYPHQLSGGLRQRVAIAIALACGPRLLIADEPTTALDVTVQAGILDLLARCQKAQAMAMLLISHDLGVVAGRTQRTAVMYAGRILELAPTRKLFGKPRLPYTRALLDAMPRLANPPRTPLKAIGGQPPDMTHLPPGCAFAPRCRWARGRCRVETPPLESGRGGDHDHRVACWYPLEGA